MIKYPFLHLEMCFPAPKMEWNEIFRWRNYLNSGGTLFLDVCPDSKTRLEQRMLNLSWKDWGKSIFPGTSWSPLNRKHTLSFSFYLLERKMLLQNDGSPFSLLEIDGRVAFIHNKSPRWSWQKLKNSNTAD